jgi:hypothetical protein
MVMKVLRCMCSALLYRAVDRATHFQQGFDNPLVVPHKVDSVLVACVTLTGCGVWLKLCYKHVTHAWQHL